MDGHNEQGAPIHIGSFTVLWKSLLVDNYSKDESINGCYGQVLFQVSKC